MSPHRTWRRLGAMRDAIELPEHIAAPSAIRSIGSKLSLQRGAKFREEMGNGLRLRITQNDGHKPKTRKEITL
jgi:hypothetical protein